MPKIRRQKGSRRATDEEQPNAYLEKVRRKRQQNEEKLNQLGLSQLSTNIKNIRAQQTSNRTNKGSSSVGTTNGPVRRSSRVCGKPVEYTPEEFDHDKELLNDKIRRRKATVKRGTKLKRRTFDLSDQISDEKRKLFEPISTDDWVEDMELYFSENQGNSVSNVQRVMSIVHKLVAGTGIRHPHSQEFFKKGVKISLDMDFRSMLDEASEWVYNNGGDLGNGWLIEHPVKKLWTYQQARAGNKKAFHSQSMP